MSYRLDYAIKRFSMINTSIRVVQRAMQTASGHPTLTYQDAVKALNGLQSNAAYIRTAPKHYCNNSTLQDTHKYLARSGITVDQLNSLSVIHVAGTKGKGSTCALVDAVLRAHGLRTVLYTSPHLITVRERIRVNGSVIPEAEFTRHFWKLYRTLDGQREHSRDMPPYFKFLTILMFHVCLSLPVDVAIIEVGIGGEYDCTNVVRSPVCVGVTSLGLDHVSLLGDTLASIAWQKAGIFKPQVPAFTVKQPLEAIEVLQRRSAEKGCTLTVVPELSAYQWSKYPPDLGIVGDVQHENAALAVKLAETWLRCARVENDENVASRNSRHFSIRTTEAALRSCRWPGRTQILRGRTADFHLDGAHTLDSMRVCVVWFKRAQQQRPAAKRVLIFNSTGDRDSRQLLRLLRDVDFDRAFFAPNVSGTHCPDQDNFTVTSEEQLQRCRAHCAVWGPGAAVGNSVLEVLNAIQREFSGDRVQVLITGSLHLVGAALAVLDPELTMTTTF